MRQIEGRKKKSLEGTTMKSPRELLGQVVGRRGRPPMAGMTVELIRHARVDSAADLQAHRSKNRPCLAYKAPGAISIEVLSGRMRGSLPSENVELGSGEHDAQRQRATGPTSAEADGASRFEAAARQAALEHLTPDRQAMFTEWQLRPNFDTEVRGTPFAPIEGYLIVKSGPTSFRHRGFYLVDEPYKHMTAPQHRREYVASAEAQPGARIPGEVPSGEQPVDTASMSLVPPTPEELGLRSSVDASYPDLRHLARGGPHLASHN